MQRMKLLLEVDGVIEDELDFPIIEEDSVEDVSDDEVFFVVDTELDKYERNMRSLFDEQVITMIKRHLKMKRSDT